MISSDIPELPWHTVGSDLFHWNGTNYLIIVDNYSIYFEIAKLENISAKTVISHFKSIFARHGVPSLVRSDSGSQYTSILRISQNHGDLNTKHPVLTTNNLMD